MVAVAIVVEVEGPVTLFPPTPEDQGSNRNMPCENEDVATFFCWGLVACWVRSGPGISICDNTLYDVMASIWVGGVGRVCSVVDCLRLTVDVVR